MASIHPDGPGAGIRRTVGGMRRRLAGSPEPTGRLERCPTLVYRQFSMQLRKRRPSRP